MTSMINYKQFLNSIPNTKLARLGERLPSYIEEGLSTKRHGDLSGWLDALRSLPEIHPSTTNLHTKASIGCSSDASREQWQQLEQCFKALIPWRKGPYSLFGLEIDTEWRSDWKWDRLLPHITPLGGRQVLDVGCGNGYHCLRMHGCGAERVIGIDPSPRFIVQFYMLKNYLGNIPVDILPAGIEDLPTNMEAFDTTFSMGVLYHRRSPMDHLRQLKNTLLPGGELILETLVIDGKEGQSLVPEGRYAMMNNVWFLPSTPTLESWLRKCGFIDIQTVDISNTTTEEQRTTDWMKFQSLPDFLDPNDASRTIEGHPAPKRAIFVARKPQ